MKKIFVISIIITVFIVQGYGALVWFTKAPAPVPGRCQMQAHGNVRDTIYICGGRAQGAIAIRTVHAYVPAANTWITTLPAMPGPRSHGCGDVIDTLIFAAGGFDSSGTARRTTYRFNANRKTWDTVAALPSAIILAAGAKGVGAMGTRVFFVFGSQNNGDTLFEYNPAINTWVTRFPATRPAGRRAAAAAGTNAYFYVMGGIDRTNAVLRDCWRFERRMGGTWTRMADMPGPRCMHATTAVVGDSVLYVVGGNPTGMGAACDSIVYKYTIASNTWTTDTRMPTSRGFLILEAEGRSIYAICGINGANYFTTNEEGSWGVGVEENKLKTLDAKIKIQPNPTQDQTTIVYHLGVRSRLTLKIYNSCGELIKTLVDRIEEPGIKEYHFNGVNLPCGIYFYNLTTDKSSANGKIMLLK